MKNNMEQFEKFSMLEHKDTITSADTPQMIFGEHQITVLEISDDEIEKAAYKWCKELDENGFVRTGDDYEVRELPTWIAGAIWYREQLKKLNEK